MISQTGRPEDGTDPKTDQHGGVLRRLEAAVGVDAEDRRARTSPAQIEDAVDRSPRSRAGDVAADSRQRAREHLADRRPDRDQGLRRRSGDAARRRPPKCCDVGLGRSRRVACLHRSRRPGPAAADRSRSRAVPRATGSTSRMSRTSSRPRSAERSATEIWEGERRFGVAVRLRERDRRDIGGDQEHPGRHAGRAARAARGSRQSIGPERQHEHQPRIGHAARGDRRLHSRARHGRHRRRSAREGRARRQVSARLLRDVRRRIRESGARDEAARAHRADQRVPDLHPAVQRVRIRRNAGDHPRQHPARGHRRHRGALSDRHPPQRVGRDRLHRAVRPGGAQRRRDGELFRGPARARATRRARP